MKRRRANTLVALSSAAVMTVYTAGYMRTRAAAEKLDHIARERPPARQSPAPVSAEMTPTTLPVASIPAPEATDAKRSPEAAVATPASEAIDAKPASGSIAPVPAPVAAIAPTPIPVEPKPAPTKATAVPAVSKPATPVDVIPTQTGTEPKPAGLDVAPPPASVPAPPVALHPEAPAAPAAAPSAEVLLGVFLKDGTYLGWGSSRHGDIQASVTLQYGRITAVSIAQCRTRYSCDVIAHLPAKVLKDQTPEKINNVSGATQSVDAFYYAVVDALKKAQ